MNDTDREQRGRRLSLTHLIRFYLLTRRVAPRRCELDARLALAIEDGAAGQRSRPVHMHRYVARDACSLYLHLVRAGELYSLTGSGWHRATLLEKLSLRFLALPSLSCALPFQPSIGKDPRLLLQRKLEVRAALGRLGRGGRQGHDAPRLGLGSGEPG